ncbi:MAG: four helix bundle protein [Bacteroidetes bacterium]|nr:four helix bundle protein [Bacteroidota bacterium]
MNQEELKKRTRAFALAIIKLVERLPRGLVTDVIARQLVKSGTSVGANYRAACRARSRAEFIAKMGVVEEEADESAYWLEILVDAGILARVDVDALLGEADELVAITVSSIQTARGHRRS